MKRILFIIYFLMLISAVNAQTTRRLKDLPNSIDSLASADVLIADQISSGETKKVTVESIRKGLPLATQSAKGLLAPAEKKALSKFDSKQRLKKSAQGELFSRTCSNSLDTLHIDYGETFTNPKAALTIKSEWGCSIMTVATTYCTVKINPFGKGSNVIFDLLITEN